MINPIKHRWLLLTLIIASLHSCNTNSKTDLGIPDHVTVNNTTALVRMPGTKLLVYNPRGYELIPSLLRLQKNDSTFIQFFEAPGANFTAKVDEVRKGFANSVKSGKLPPFYYEKEFLLGAYKALIFYAADNKPGLEQIGLVFGDSTFTVMAVGEIPAKNAAARDEIVSALLKTAVDKSLANDDEVLKSFDLDLSGTDFKYAGKMSQVFYYTANGNKNPAQDPFSESIMVITYPPFPSSDFRKRTEGMTKRWQQAGISIKSATENIFALNKYEALETILEGEFQGRKNKIYFLTTSNEEHSIMYIGITYEGTERLFPQIQAIAKTLTIK